MCSSVHASSSPGAGQRHGDPHAEPLLEPLLGRRAQRRVALGRRARHHVHDHLVAVPLAQRAHEVVALERGIGQRDLADRLGPDVHAAQLHHVVGAARERPHPPQPAPARALLARVQDREVLDVVAELRAAGLVDLGDAQAAGLAVGHARARLRVDDLHDERVLEDVQPLARGTLDRDPLHLVEAVRLVVGHAEGGLERGAVADVRQRLQVEVLLRVEPHLARDLGEVQQVVAGREDRRGAVLLRELHLAPAARDVARAGREHHAAEPLVERLVERERAVVGRVGPRVHHHVAGPNALRYSARAIRIAPASRSHCV